MLTQKEIDEWDEPVGSDEPMPFYILGRKVGTYTGWDQAGGFCIQVYDFRPIKELVKPLGAPYFDVCNFDLETGDFTFWDGEETEYNVDFIKNIVDLKKEKFDA